MRDLLLDIIQYFTSLSLVEGDGKDCFRDTIPDSPDHAIAVYEYDSRLPLPQIASGTRQIQIVTRDKSYSVTRSKAYELFSSLGTEDGIISLTTERWATISLGNTPRKMKVDDKGRTYFFFNASLTTDID